MKNLKMVLEVARWEFGRYFRFRDLMLTLVFFVLGGVLLVGLGWLIERIQDEPVQIAIVNAEVLELELSPNSRIVLDLSPDRSLAELQRAVGDEELDGVLILESVDRAELLVAEEPGWQDELQSALTVARRQARIRLAGLDSELLTLLTDPFDLDVRLHEASRRPASSAKWVAFTLAGLILLGVFIGNAYLLVAITGEKQQRITEQIVTTIPVQTWIDGKILGLSLLSLTSIAAMVLSFVVTNLLLHLVGTGLDLSSFPVDPVMLAQFLIMTVLGFLLWFTFFAAIAATIDDPNTSARNSFLFFPVLALGVAFAVPVNPDALLFRVTAIFPLTSSTVLPARLAMTEVEWWEFLLAAGLVVCTIWFLRLAAGKIFALGVLMYGKEPTWGEMWRTLRATR